MTFNFAKAAFMIEILLAELIFLFPAEKRSLFPLRYAGLFLMCIVIGGFFPIEYTDGLLAQFLMFFLMFLITVGAMALCFSVSFSVLISCCVAGYAVEHIAFHIVKLRSITASCRMHQQDRFKREHLPSLPCSR